MTTFGTEFQLSSLNGANGFQNSGAAVGDQFGASVASAGDINGDGLGDLLIGARAADPNGADSGASYVVFGRAGGFAADLDLSDLSSIDGTNGFKVLGEAQFDNAGASVSAAGDVNGDGFDDFIIGAPGADPSGGESGASYVVFGRGNGFSANLNLSTLNGSNGFQINGEVSGDASGESVASAGDINGDGFDDLIIGAEWADANASNAGASYVVFGRASFAATVNLSSVNGTNGFQISGEAANDESGSSVASIGDFNGDGFDDLVVGAPFSDANGNTAGASYVVFGRAGAFATNLNLSTLDGTNGFQINGEAASDLSGWSVAAAGDFNGDGLDDLVVGAPQAPNGASYVVFGRTGGFTPNLQLFSLNGTTGFKITGEGGDAGNSVASAGDINGDGFDDLIIGAKGAAPNGSGSGASYVVFGRAGGFAANLNLSALDGSTGFQISGETGFNQTGASVASAGDLNGDGFDDMVIGANTADANGTFSGAAYVVFGKATRGSAGNDVLDASGADDALGGFGGNDIIRGNGGFDSLSGGDGNDQLFGGAAVDSLAGGAGNDILDGGAAADQLYGGSGNDSYALGAETSGVDGVVDADGTDTITSTINRSLAFGAFSEIENLALLAGAVGTGNALSNTITGNAAVNTLNGLTNVDTLIGGGSSDTYVIDSTIDTIVEAAGTAAGTADHVLFTGLANQTYLLAANVERLTLAGAAASRGAGNLLANLMTGNAAGNVLDGGLGNDVIRGLGGSDTITGGAGVDTLTGGAQSDVFVLRAPVSAANRDVVTDFTNAAGNNDTFRLENAVMAGLGAAGALKTPAFFAGIAAHDADDRIVYNRTTGALFYDANGNGAGGATLLATLTNKPTLTAADFVVI